MIDSTNVTEYTTAILAECFDRNYRIAAGIHNLALSDIDGEYQADLFRLAPVDIRSEALCLYFDVRSNDGALFREFISKRSGKAWDPSLLEISAEEKSRITEGFNAFRWDKGFRTMFWNAGNPIYFTGWYNGIAVLAVQNPDKLRSELLNAIAKYVCPEGMSIKEFVELDSREREEQFAKSFEPMAAEIDAINFRLP